MMHQFKQIFVFSIALMAIISAQAEYEIIDTIQSGNTSIDIRLEYSVGDGKATVTGISYYSYQQWSKGVPVNGYVVNVPSTLGGCPVIAIGDSAFKNEGTKIGGINLPEGIVSIGAFAFRYCDQVYSLTIPGSVIYIGRLCIDDSGVRTVIFNEGSSPLTLGEKALSTGSYGSGPSNIIFHRDAPEVIGESAIPWNNTGGNTVWVRPTTKGWGVQIPGTWPNYTTRIKYLKAVYFDANGGAITEGTRWKMDGECVGTLPIPEREEAIFLGWFTERTGGTEINDALSISEDVTFYAQWTVNQYTVTFDPNEGEGGDSRTKEYGSPFGELPTPQRKNYFFLGWFTEKDGGELVSETSTVAGEKTYYAHWERDPLPELSSGDSVADALDGFSDIMLSQKITKAREYKSYRNWVDENSLVHKDVKESPNAWLAYALDAPELIAKVSAVAKEDFAFQTITKCGDGMGNMVFDFGIDGVTIGEDAELGEVFSVTGSPLLEDGSFTESGIDASFERMADGKVSVSVTPPKDSNGELPAKYFFRIEVK